MDSGKKWLPLESNPEVMNKFLSNVGVPSAWNVIDVIDLDDEHLDALPKKVAAVLLLFPTGEQHEEFCQQQAAAIEEEGQTVSDRVYFIKMSQKNASGTVALVHSVANSGDKIELAEDSSLHGLLERTKDMSPEERGQELEMDEAICEIHESSAKEGQSQAPDEDEDTGLQFITFVNVDEQLYELDGRKQFPINHGSTSDDTLLKDSVTVCKQFMERDPENVNFTLLALVESEGAEDGE